MPVSLATKDTRRSRRVSSSTAFDNSFIASSRREREDRARNSTRRFARAGTALSGHRRHVGDSRGEGDGGLLWRRSNI